MINNEKKELLNSMIPKAVLKAITEESEHAIFTKVLGQNIIPIYSYPFKIGREARVKYIDGNVVFQDRHKLSSEESNNDAYLFDTNDFLQISREHCSIIKHDDKYILQDRGSACGSMVNQIMLGKDNNVHELKDGDIITIGSEKSQYKYKYIVLDISYK